MTPTQPTPSHATYDPEPDPTMLERLAPIGKIARHPIALATLGTLAIVAYSLFWLVGGWVVWDGFFELEGPFFGSTAGFGVGVIVAMIWEYFYIEARKR